MSGSSCLFSEDSNALKNDIVDVFYPDFCNRAAVALNSLDSCQDVLCCSGSLSSNNGEHEESLDQEVLDSYNLKKCFCSHSAKCEICKVLNDSIIEDSIDKIKLHKQVRDSGKYNFEGCRIIVNKRINGDFMRRMLFGYKDMQVVDMLQFGFPIGFSGDRVQNISNEIDHKVKNHGGAEKFPNDINKYLAKEASFQAIIGPFKKNPFVDRISLAPLNSVPKASPSE